MGIKSLLILIKKGKRKGPNMMTISLNKILNYSIPRYLLSGICLALKKNDYNSSKNICSLNIFQTFKFIPPCAVTFSWCGRIAYLIDPDSYVDWSVYS